MKIKRKKDIKQGVFYTRLLEGSERGTPSLKEEKENRFIARDVESLCIESTDNFV